MYLIDPRLSCSYPVCIDMIYQEVLAGKRYDAKADMFSLGCLLHEMCALKPPIFRQQDDETHAQDR
ncbi:hypothetical protein EHS25_005677 [Saitozyma podzolica]|uniref:Protein kinase domain-containing protein n=1 Tax=Saitozyma podzolica TaxID=1890683 RepID=A0A427XVP4_9TREE|nr:hypothetical protein EHS25_005677 [Saitozyma podzolica]